MFARMFPRPGEEVFEWPFERISDLLKAFKVFFDHLIDCYNEDRLMAQNKAAKEKDEAEKKQLQTEVDRLTKEMPTFLLFSFQSDNLSDVSRRAHATKRGFWPPIVNQWIMDELVFDEKELDKIKFQGRQRERFARMLNQVWPDYCDAADNFINALYRSPP